MKKTVLSAFLLIFSLAGHIKSQEVNFSKNTSIGLFWNYQGLWLRNYAREKADFISFSVAPDALIYSAYPGEFDNYGIQLNTRLSPGTRLCFRSMSASHSGFDAVDFTTVNRWKFNSQDRAIGINFVFPRYYLIFWDEQISLGAYFGVNSVEYSEAGSISKNSSEDSHNSYTEFNWSDNIFLNYERNVSFDITLNYKFIQPATMLGYDFDFSGFGYSLGLSYWFGGKERYKKVSAKPARKETVNNEELEGIITINVPNNRGTYTPVRLKKSKDGYIGPQGEFYKGNPSVEQLKILYGK